MFVWHLTNCCLTNADNLKTVCCSGYGFLIPQTECQQDITVFDELRSPAHFALQLSSELPVLITRSQLETAGPNVRPERFREWSIACPVSGNSQPLRRFQLSRPRCWSEQDSGKRYPSPVNRRKLVMANTSLARSAALKSASTPQHSTRANWTMREQLKSVNTSPSARIADLNSKEPPINRRHCSIPSRIALARHPWHIPAC